MEVSTKFVQMDHWILMPVHFSKIFVVFVVDKSADQQHITKLYLNNVTFMKGNSDNHILNTVEY